MSQNTMNIPGNEAGSVTEGLPETRSMLKRLAVKEGPDSPISHGSHNMLELTEKLAKGAEGEQRRQIMASLERQQNRLAGLRQ